MCVVLHLPAGAESCLAAILSRAGPLKAVQARGSEPLVPGRICPGTEEPFGAILLVSAERTG